MQVAAGRYGADGDYTLEVTCPDNRPDLALEDATAEPHVILSNQLVRIQARVSMPDSLEKGNDYIILHVDANNVIDETDENLNFAYVSVQVPDSGKLDCTNTISLVNNVAYYGNTLTDGDSVVDNYSCFWGLTNKETVHDFTPEFSGLAEIEFPESLPGTMNILILTSCNENTCINSFGIWESEDTVATDEFHVTGGLTYYLVVDGNNDFGNAEGPYLIKVKYPEKCPKPKIETFSTLNKCDGEPGAYLYTNWEYRNFQWLKDDMDIPGATNASFRAEETGIYTVNSPDKYNDDIWHLATATLSSEGIIIRIRIAENNFCGGPDSTNIILENSEPNILYQLIYEKDSLPVGPATEGNSGTISLPTASLSESIGFLISATNGKTLCQAFLDTTLMVNIKEKKVPEVNIYSDAGVGGICDGDTIHFYSSTLNGGSNPAYRWQLNDTPSETTPVIVYDLPEIFLGNDTSVYTGDSLVLDAGAGFSAYTWNTGSADRTVLIESNSGTGIYQYAAEKINNS